MATMLVLRRRIVAAPVATTVPAPEVAAKAAHKPVPAVPKLNATQILQRAKGRQVTQTSQDSAVARAQMAERAKRAIEDQLKLVSQADDAIDAAVEAKAQAFKIIEAQLRLVNLDGHIGHGYMAALTENWTRQGRTIDPKKFRNAVAADVFWSCIGVSVMEAKKHMTDAELNKISDIIESVSTGFTLKVDKVSAKKKRTKV